MIDQNIELVFLNPSNKIKEHSTCSLIGKLSLVKTNHVAWSSSGSIIWLIGMVSCDVSFKNKHLVGICHLTDRSDFNWLWLEWIEELNLFSVPLTLSFTHYRLPQLEKKSQTHLKPSSAVFSWLALGVVLRWRLV